VTKNVCEVIFNEYAGVEDEHVNVTGCDCFAHALPRIILGDIDPCNSTMDACTTAGMVFAMQAADA